MARRPLGFQQITVLTTSTPLTVPTGTKEIQAVCEAQAVRWRDDSVAPTATVGMPLAVGTLLEYQGAIRNLLFIEQAVGAKLNITYFGG